MKETPHSVVDLAFELGRLMKREMAGADGDHVTTFLRLQGLTFIHENPDITMSQFAKHFHVSASTATSLVNRMVELGWVARASDPANRKLVRLRLTAKGRSSMQSCLRARAKILHRSIASISPEDQRTLSRILHTIIDALRDEPLPSPTSSHSHGHHS